MRRQKMISFRLTPDEYARMQTLRETSGARTVSDIARFAVRSLIVSEAAVPHEMSLVDRLCLVEVRLSNLTAEVNRLSRCLSPDAHTTSAAAGA